MTAAIDDALRIAAAAQRVATERALGPLGITPAQFAVLRIVVANPTSSSADVARLERLTPPTVSVIVGNLERMGALTRHPDPKGGRIQILQPTASGRELAEKAGERVLTLQSRIEAAIPANRRPEIEAWLRRVAEIEV